MIFKSTFLKLEKTFKSHSNFSCAQSTKFLHVKNKQTNKRNPKTLYIGD